MSAVLGLDADWLQRLRQRLDMQPLRPRLPLVLAVADTVPRTIGSIESTLAAALAGARFPLRDADQAWRIELPSADAVDPALAAIAQWLHANGHASAWRNELLDVTDAGGQVRGAIERAAVRPLGIATCAVHLVVSDARGGVWVQQRALDKAVDPGLWDTTVGGLVSARESTRTTLERETWEEAGLRLAQLREIHALGRFTVRRPLAEGYMVEHIDMFAAEAVDGATPANQDGEVAGFECIARAELIARLHADAFTLEAAMILVQCCFENESREN